MNRELINPDDPQMTAYALGELSVAEAAEFEARLQSSPMAQAELASMRGVMDLLSDGLRGEWQTGLKCPELKLLEPVFSERSVLVEGNFRPLRRNLAIAAAVAGMVLVGGVVVTSEKGREVAASSEEIVGVSLLAAVGETPSVHVPQLFLAEEVEDISRLDLADESSVSSPIDASYLDAGHVIPASFAPATGSFKIASDRGDHERVDSYLPPLSDYHFGRSLKTGMIERRLNSGALAPFDARRGDSVFVSGYVTMGSTGQQESTRVLAGFRPVSISGNPVVNEEADLQLLADLNGLQKDLSEVIKGMPESSAEKPVLEGILEKNRRLISQLMLELTR
jgi:hypothetical protein